MRIIQISGRIKNVVTFHCFLEAPLKNLKTSRCMQYFHFVLKTNLCAKKRNITHFVRYFLFLPLIISKHAIEHFHVTSLPPCWRAKTIHFLSPGKWDLFSCKTVSLFQITNIYMTKIITKEAQTKLQKKWAHLKSWHWARRLVPLQSVLARFYQQFRIDVSPVFRVPHENAEFPIFLGLVWWWSIPAV